MASDNSSYFSNGFPSDNLTFDGQIFQTKATPLYALGFRVGRADGSVFRYSQYGTATSAARLVSTTNADFGAESDNALTVGSAATAIVGDAVLPGNNGAKWVQVVGSLIVKNQYSGGYLIIESGTGSSAGGTYRIKGNTASGTPVAGQFYIELYDRLQTTLDATTDIAIISNPYSDLGPYTRVTATVPVGVSVANMLTTSDFGFTQTWGVCACLVDAHTPALNEMVVPSAITAGAVSPYAASSVGTVAASDLTAGPIVGYFLQAATASRQVPIFLTLSR